MGGQGLCSVTAENKILIITSQVGCSFSARVFLVEIFLLFKQILVTVLLESIDLLQLHITRLRHPMVQCVIPSYITL